MHPPNIRVLKFCRPGKLSRLLRWRPVDNNKTWSIVISPNLHLRMLHAPIDEPCQPLAEARELAERSLSRAMTAALYLDSLKRNLMDLNAELEDCAKELSIVTRCS